ncbi:MAG: hypothetical protein JXJ22_16450 [Bacteroidales bacterium]|nr:hypothetical protein [Bacteroidales bacterium]
MKKLLFMAACVALFGFMSVPVSAATINHNSTISVFVNDDEPKKSEDTEKEKKSDCTKTTKSEGEKTKSDCAKSSDCSKKSSDCDKKDK